MAKTTQGDILIVNAELLQAFFQCCVRTGALTDDAMNTIFAMTAERLSAVHKMTADSGAFACLNQMVANVKLFADAREKERQQHAN
jgi:hypothetical protein